MIKIITSIGVLFVIQITILYGQGKITGSVVYQNSNFTPAVGVKVNANGSNGAFSKSDGGYTLEFPHYEAGATIYPRIGEDNVTTDAKGKEVELVNAKELEFVSIPKNPTLAPMRIVVCPKGERDLAAQKYYRIIKVESDRQLIERLEEVKALKDKLGEVHNLVAQKQEALELLYRKSDSLTIYKEALEIASINRDGAKQRVLNYLDALDAGVSIAEARRELSTAQAYTEAMTSQESIIASINEIKADFRASLAAYKYDEAIAKYDTILLILESEQMNPMLLVSELWAVADICADIDKDANATRYYERGLAILEKDYSPIHEKRAALSNNLAIVHENNNRPVDAERLYLQALNIRAQLLEKDSSNTQLMDVSRVLNNLGSLYHNQFQNKVAIEYYNACLKARQRLYQADSVKYAPAYAAILQSLSLVAISLEQEEVADKYAEEYYQIIEKIYTDNSTESLEVLAEAQEFLGSIFYGIRKYSKNRKDEGIAYLKSSLKIYEELNKRNNRLYRKQYAHLLTRIGHSHAYTNIDSMLIMYTEANEIFKQLAKDNFNKYGFDLARSYETISYYYDDYTIKQYDEAERFKFLALDIVKKLRASNSLEYRFKLVDMYNNISRFYSLDVHDREKMMKYYFLSLGEYQSLITDGYEINKDDYSGVLNSIGYAYVQDDKLQEAIPYYRMAIAVRQSMVIEEDDHLELSKEADLLNRLGMIYVDLDSLDLAREVYTKAIAIEKPLTELANRHRNATHLAKYYLDFAYLMRKEMLVKSDIQLKSEGLKYLTLTEEALLKSEADYAELNKKYPDIKGPEVTTNMTYQEQVAKLKTYFENITVQNLPFYSELWLISVMKQKVSAMKNQRNRIGPQKEIIDRYKHLEKKYSEEVYIKQEMASAYGSLAWYYIFAEDFKKAEKAAKQGLQLDSNQVWINTNLALAYLLLGKYDKAKALYLQYKDVAYADATFAPTFLADLDILEKEGISNDDFEKIRALLK